MSDFVPKIHPATRELAAEDPLELVATPVGGDPDVMLDCLIQDYAWMGLGIEELCALFHSPGYPLLGQLLAHFGPEEVRRRVERLAARGGVLRVREELNVEPPADDEDDEPLYQINLGPCGAKAGQGA